MHLKDRIFTSSINKSEIYSKLLKKKILNMYIECKKYENEAQIIADAGKERSVIITTVFLEEV